jgi:carboxypeptidase PM20D1
MEVLSASDYTEPTDIEGAPFRTVQRVVAETFPGCAGSPYVMTGATDARFYQEICEHVARFAPVIYGPEQMQGMHGLNENIEYSCLPGAVDFYQNLIRAVGE